MLLRKGPGFEWLVVLKNPLLCRRRVGSPFLISKRRETATRGRRLKTRVFCEDKPGGATPRVPSGGGSFVCRCGLTSGGEQCLVAPCREPTLRKRHLLVVRVIRRRCGGGRGGEGDERFFAVC